MPPIPDGIPESDQELIQELLDAKPPEFTDLTLTQYEAFEDGALSDGNHLLVAETGNGKTFVAEAVTKKALQNGDNVAYLVPSVSLVNEKHEQLNAWTPEGVMIGQGAGYTESDVIVATFESYFEAVIRGYADRFDTVILDDFHEIYSTQRGPNIEKGISAALDGDADILGISATIGNPHTIARWLDATLTISSEERAVPITEHPIEKTGDPYAEQIARIIDEHNDKGPFLVFNDTKPNAETRARGVADALSFDTGGVNFRELVEDAVSTTLTETHEELIQLLNNGIAYHHSGLEKGLKDMIETYTENGVIKCVFCTTTLSYGFDSPVQSVIVADLKRNWEGKYIGVYEYVQWIGRAGRDADRYDEAYAFVMYNYDETFDRFQFDTPVEEKDIEDITSHLSGENALRWLVLELVTYGWETDRDVLQFIESTLFWSETVDQIPEYVDSEFGIQPGEQVRQEVDTVFNWLTTHGLTSQPVGQPQRDVTRYTATELGNALVEFEHSNWFDNTVSDVLRLTEWLHDQGDELTPEALISRLADQYYHCELGFTAPDGSWESEQMDKHGMYGGAGTTAALICWFWCAGISVKDLENRYDSDDVSSLVSAASNLSTAIQSVQNLYEPVDMPREPEWLTPLAQQVNAGVPGPDLYLLDTVDHFGRRLYNNLKEKINTAGRGNPWDPGKEYFLIERLDALYDDAGRDMFRSVIIDTHGIGDTIARNIIDSVNGWDPNEYSRITVPFAETARARAEDEVFTTRQPSGDPGGGPSSGAGSSVQSTTLDDF